MRLIDMDTHFSPTDEFARVPDKFKDLAPRWEPCGDGQVVLVTPGRPGPPPKKSGTYSPQVREPGDFDAAIRLRDMDRMGVEKQLLSPEFTQLCFEYEPILGAALCRSSNIAVGEVLRGHPDRFVGAAVLPTQDIEVCVEEAERAFDEGFRSFFMKAAQGGKNLGDSYFWPLYEVANRRNVPIVVHASSKDLGAAVHTERLREPWAVSVNHLTDYLFCICSLIYDGAFDAFPNLRFCFSEAGATWIPWLKDRMVLTYDFRPSSRAQTQKHPTEYLNSNIYVTIDPTEEALGYVCDKISSKNLMLGSDYPHGDLTGRGHSDDHIGDLKRTHIDLLLEREDLSQEVKEDIAYRNALEFFGGHVA